MFKGNDGKVHVRRGAQGSPVAHGGACVKQILRCVRANSIAVGRLPSSHRGTIYLSSRGRLPQPEPHYACGQGPNTSIVLQLAPCLRRSNSTCCVNLLHPLLAADITLSRPYRLPVLSLCRSAVAPQVKVKRRGSDVKHVATVLAVGTECDIGG